MSTRGLVGFYKDGITKATYCHFDSYPGGLGVDVLGELRELSRERLCEVFDQIEMVAGGDVPSVTLQKKYRRFLNTGVSTQQSSEWYCLLRRAQGGISAWVSKGCTHMINGADFIKASTFCEYAYIINLDNEGSFEAYVGFQDKAHTAGRYCTAEANGSGAYPCRLVASWPFSQLPTDEELLAVFRDEDADE